LYARAGSLGLPMGWKNLGLLYARGLGVPKDPEKARKYLTKAAEQDVPGAAEALQAMTPARAFPATALRIGCLFLLVIVAFLGMGLWDGVPSERLFSGGFAAAFAACAVFIRSKVEQRQPKLPKPLRILYIVLGALLVLAGILVLLSLPGSGEPITAEDYWLVGCALLGGGALLYRAMGKKNKA